MPKIGEPLSSYNLTNLAYKNQESITELIKHVINQALDNKINFLHVPVDLDTEIAAVLSKFRHTRLKLHFFVKSLKQAKAPDLEDAKLYIDASELWSKALFQALGNESLNLFHFVFWDFDSEATTHVFIENAFK